MNRHTLFGLILFTIVLVWGGYELFADKDLNTMSLAMFSFPVMIMPYYQHKSFSAVKPTFYKIVYYGTVGSLFFIIITSSFTLIEFAPYIEIVYMIAFLIGAFLALIFFLGYIILFIDASNHDNEYVLFYVITGLLTVGYLFLDEHLVLIQIMCVLFAVVSLSTLYVLFIKRFN